MEHNPLMKRYLPGLDVLRLAAFLLIFFHHAHFPDPAVSFVARKIGWIGVDIFFCLSAFLLGRLLLEEKEANGRIDIAAYFVRRILRIWPLYFIYVLLAVVFHFAFAGSSPEWVRVGGL